MPSQRISAIRKRAYAFARRNLGSEWFFWAGAVTIALLLCSLLESFLKLVSVAKVVITYWRAVLNGLWRIIVSFFFDTPVTPLVRDQATVIFIFTGFIGQAIWKMSRPAYRRQSYSQRTAGFAGAAILGGMTIIIFLVELQHWGTPLRGSSTDGFFMFWSLFLFIITYILAIQKDATFTNITIAKLLWRTFALAAAIVVLDYIGRLITNFSSFAAS